jgi:hypothetical protein
MMMMTMTVTMGSPFTPTTDFFFFICMQLKIPKIDAAVRQADKCQTFMEIQYWQCRC